MLQHLTNLRSPVTKNKIHQESDSILATHNCIYSLWYLNLAQSKKFVLKDTNNPIKDSKGYKQLLCIITSYGMCIVELFLKKGSEKNGMFPSKL